LAASGRRFTPHTKLLFGRLRDGVSESQELALELLFIVKRREIADASVGAEEDIGRARLCDDDDGVHIEGGEVTGAVLACEVAGFVRVVVVVQQVLGDDFCTPTRASLAE